MDVSEFENALVTLTRYVRTPEGAQKFGLPIGSPITPDAVAYAKSHGFDGMKVPEDSQSSSKKPNHMAGTISGKAAAEKNRPKPAAAPKLKLKITKPTISGNKHFSVGGSKYTAPNNSKLIKPTQDGLVYVVTPDGKVHAFNSAGEIQIPKTLNAVFEAKFGPDFEGDENYSTEEFEATSAASSLDSQKVGAILTDTRGNPQFKKTGPDSWEHIDLGVKLKDADLQALYDEGELLPDTTDEDTAVAEETFSNVEANNFKELSMAETVSALDTMKPGQKVTLASETSGDRVFVKQEDGNWLADGTNPAGEPWQPTESSVLGYVKDFLTVGEGEKKDNPLEGNPLDENDKPKLGKGDKPTPEWVNAAAPNSEMVFDSPNGGKTTWTKQDNQSWINQNGGHMSPSGMIDALPMGGDKLKITKDGNDLTADGLDKSKMSPQMRAKVETDEKAGLHDAPAPEQIREKKPTTRSSSSLVPGEGDYTETAIDEDIVRAEVGDKVLVSFADGSMVSEYEMQENGSWLNVDDETESLGALTMSAMAEDGGAEQVYLNTSNGTAAVSSTKVAFHEGMGGIDVGSEESKYYLIPGEHDYAAETTEEDITDAQPGDKILVAVDPDYEDSSDYETHYEANELLEKNPDGSWKSLTYPTNQITEHDLLGDVQSSQFQYGSTQLYTFKGNSTQAGSNVDSGVSQKTKGAESGTENGLAGGNSGSGGSQGVAGELRPSGGDDGSGDSGSNGGGVQLEDGTAPALLNGGKPLTFTSRVADLAEQGVPVAELYELDPAKASGAFHGAISKLKENNPYHASVYVYPQDEYADMRLFLNSDGTAGVALHGDEIVSVFVQPNSKDKGSARSLIAQAVAQGGKRLDAFDTVLPKIYAKEGFTPVARTPWNDDYKPDGWDYATYQAYNEGKPDVVFMAYSESALGSTYDPSNKVGYVEDYDAGVSAVKSYLSLQSEGTADEALPAGVPKGSIKIDTKSLDSVGVGGHIFEYQPAFKEALEYEKTGDADMPWSAQLPSGLKAPLKQSYFDQMNSSFYLAPSAEDLNPTGDEVLEDWEKELLAPFDSTADQPKTFKVGDTINGVEDLDAQAPHTALAYTKKDGSQSKYVKLENGSWLTPGGGVMASIQLKGSAKSGKFKVESVPDVAPTKVPSGPYAEGDVIKKYGHLRDMPDGTILTENTLAGDFISDIEKKNGEWWSVPNEKFLKAHKLEPNDLADDILGGILLFKQEPAPDEPSGVMDTQLYSGAPMMSHKDIQDAYIALKNHTSFQVAYGLKALDDNHPLANKDAQTALKAAALSKYPDLKPKPAVMEYLKDALGIQDEKKSAVVAPDAPKVWLGAKNPKEGVQGFDGGEFTAAEIQGAIDILENYPGKLFKSELNKKGNPLGKLNPNDLVGFDKDKLVTKQKLIDLLKTKLTVNEEILSHPLVKDMEEFKSLPVGAKVYYFSGTNKQVYTKINDSQWSYEDLSGSAIIDNTVFESFVKHGKIHVESIPDSVPEYAKAPAAVQDKQVDEVQVDNFTVDDIDWASPGTILVTTKEEPQIKLIKKPGVDEGWTSIEVATGFESPLVFKNNELKAVWEKWGLQLQGQDGPSMNTEKTGLTPGKYVSGGKAYMIVNADGTGVYVNTKGDVQKLTAKAVKSNYDKGMNKYEGVPDSTPTPTTKKASVAAKPKVVGDIADGTYFAGNPNNPKTSVYTVEGDSVKVYKPAVVEGYKLNQEVTQEWMDEASTGAAMKYKYDSNSKAIAFTKGSDGLWHAAGDSDAESFKSVPYHWSYKIASHGLSSEPVEMQKKKVNTLFSQGKFTDANGNSVVPEGYSGAVFYFGASTTIPALLAVQNGIKDKEFGSAKELADDIQAKGLFFDKKLMGDFTEKNYGAKTLENYVSAISDSISEMTKGLDTDIPESDASTLFEWNDLGEAQMPVELAAMNVYQYQVSSVTNFIKEASKQIGGGKVIGQHYTKMDKYTKKNWYQAFMAGDFKKMYDLEVAAAAKEGKAHNAGYLHPGYEGNAATNKVAWGAAVSGEVSALVEIPGEWTAVNASPSIAEVNNYLIKAQMQNPTFLSNHEKRIWMTAHRTHQKETVDTLSATAALRKKSGDAPQSDPLTWTDDVKPAKSYDYLFEDNQFPTNWTTEMAKDYYNDQLTASGGSGATAIADMTPDEAFSFVEGLAVGEKIQAGFGENGLYVKLDSGMWGKVVNPDAPPVSQATLLLAKNKLTYVGEITPKAVDFDAMTTDQAIEYLDGPSVKSIAFHGGTILTKNSDGTWHSPVTGTDSPSSQLASLKSGLSVPGAAGVQDNPDIAELKAAWADAHQNYGSYSAPMYGVQSYFQKKKEEADAKALIPVYSMKPNQTVKKSTHPTFPYQDQFGNSYWFKPAYANKDGKYRAEAEHLGNEMGRIFGFQTPASQLLEVDGKYGQLQNDAGGIGDMLNFNYSTLTEKQIADIGSEHILDWILDNDDTHGANAQIMANGHIVGIDKGRAFKHYGAWNGLSGNSSMDSNAHTVYSQLFDAIRSGKLNKQDVDNAYLSVQRKADKMSKVPDSKITDMLAEGMKNREQWDIKYSIDGKPVPKSLVGLTAAVLDRKSKLPDQVHDLWAKVYKDAGYGDLPEKPTNPLGDTISGLHDTRLHEQVFQAHAAGKTTMVGGAHIIGGSATVWSQKNSNNETEVLGEMFLGPKKQKEMLDYFVSNSTDLTPGNAQTQGFHFDTFGNSLVGAAKTINHHATDGEYNQEKINDFGTVKAKIESDISEWKPGLVSNSDLNGDPSYKFLSGTNIPMQYVDQYKLMLDHYAPYLKKIQDAYDTKGKTGIVDSFTPLTLSKKQEQFQHEDGSTLKKLADGKFLYNNAATGQVTVEGPNADVVAGAVNLENDWHVVTPSKDLAKGGVTIVKKSNTFEKTSLSYNKLTAEKIASDIHVSSGATGQEYEVTLPTGEKIYWRNAGQTSTARGQQGKLTFHIPNADDPSSVSSSMERIQAQLDVMGISTEAADHNAAELVYWREMYGILENRNHEGAGGKKYDSAYKKMQLKIKELGGNENEFLENLAEAMNSDEEVQYWRDLYSEFWPDEVQKLINEEGYLPKYDHQNLSNPELETGKPYWERFDISLEDIVNSGAVLSHSTGNHNDDPDKQGAMSSGGLISGEERIRQLGKIFTGGGYGSSSPVQDQGNGSSHQVFTRIVDSSNLSGFNVFMSPRMLLRTRTFSLAHDSYGNLMSRKNGSPSNPLTTIQKFKNNGGDETMIPHIVSVLDGIEVLAFASETERNKMIQYMKKQGLDKIRGVPVEERFVMRANVKAAIEKVRKTWLEK